MPPLFDHLERRVLLTHAVAPLAPSALAAPVTTASDVRLTFQDNSRNESGFVIERARGRQAYSTLVTLPGSTGRGLRIYDDLTVSAGLSYRYRVRAVLGSKSSAYAGPITVTARVSTPPPTETARNLLFFGNSFTFENNVPLLVKDIAAADGHVAPNVHVDANANETLGGHITQVMADGSGSIINSSLAAGQHWDDVVLQEFSTRPTDATASPVFANAPQFRKDAATLFGLVKANSPKAHAVLEETWARGASNSLYPGSYSGPAAMQDQLQKYYTLAEQDINSADGAGSANLAPVGEGWRALKWDRTLYDASDEYHPSPKGSLLAALTVYTTIYQDGTADIPASKVSADLAALGLSAADWQQLTALADAVGKINVQKA